MSTSSSKSRCAEAAVAHFQQGFACSQAVVAAFAPKLGVSPEAALKAAAGFGGGLGRQAQTCGAVNGACIVIGLRYGSTDPNDKDAKEFTYHTVREFCRQFRARHKTLQCRELLGCDISTPEGLALAREKKLFTTQCPRFVGEAAEILEQLV